VTGNASIKYSSSNTWDGIKASYPSTNFEAYFSYNGELQYTSGAVGPTRLNSTRFFGLPAYPQNDAYDSLSWGVALSAKNVTNVYSYCWSGTIPCTPHFTNLTDHYYHWYKVQNINSASTPTDYSENAGSGNWDNSCVTGGYPIRGVGCVCLNMRPLVSPWTATAPLANFDRTLYPSSTYEYGVLSTGGDIRILVFNGFNGTTGDRASIHPIWLDGDNGPTVTAALSVFGRGLVGAPDSTSWYTAIYRYPDAILRPLENADTTMVYVRFHEQTDVPYYDFV